MSDYIPHPDTEMHINQMPEECLRLLFIQLPLPDQLKAGNVCQLWRNVRDALFLTQKSLTIQIADNSYKKDKHYLMAVGLNEERAATLVAMFPRITKLTIYTNNRILDKEESSQVAHLLAQYRQQLVTLKLESKDSSVWKGTPNGTVLFDAINAMSKLKQLSLGFHLFHFNESAPFDLPILRQLDKLKFSCSRMEMSLITLWAPHLEARSTPMEIFLEIYNPTYAQNDHSALYDSITPKVASMFTRFPDSEVNLEQFQRLSTRFANLTELTLFYHGDANTNSFAVPTLMQAIANLKQLTTLLIDTDAVPLDDQPCYGRLPQLPTVKEWYLSFLGNGEDMVDPYTHGHLFAWTANLGWLFPNLEGLFVSIDNYTGCADCGFNYPNEETDQVNAEIDAQVKDCLRLQLRHIKQQQCPKLSQAEVEYAYRRANETKHCLEIACTFKDLAD